MQVVRRLLNKDLFCQPLSCHTEDATRNARYLPFLLLVNVVRQLNFVKKNQQYPPAAFESYFFSNACLRSGFAFMMAARSRSI